MGDIAQLGEPKIKDLDAARRQHDVCGFDVAVNDPCVVSGHEAIGYLDDDRPRLIDRDWTTAYPCTEGLTGAICHRDKRSPIVALADFVNRTDPRVIEGRRRPRFAVKPLSRLWHRIVEFGREEFQSNDSPQLRILGAVDDSHTASAEAIEDRVVGYLAPFHSPPVQCVFARSAARGSDISAPV